MREKINQVKVKLMLHHLKYDWLIDQFEKDEIPLTKTECSDIFNGRRTTEKARMVVDKSLEYLAKYERLFANA